MPPTDLKRRNRQEGDVIDHAILDGYDYFSSHDLYVNAMLAIIGFQFLGYVPSVVEDDYVIFIRPISKGIELPRQVLCQDRISSHHIIYMVHKEDYDIGYKVLKDFEFNAEEWFND
jgi:hypothetical protein